MKAKLPITTAVAAILCSFSLPVMAQDNKPERDSPPPAEQTRDARPDAPKQEEREKFRAMREANAKAQENALAQAQEMRRRAMLPSPPTPSEAKPWRIGVVVGPVDASLRTHLGIPEDAGVVVTELMENGPAARAGLAKNDIIVSANGRNIANIDQLRRMVSATSNDVPALKLQVIRQGKRTDIVIKRDMPKANPSAAQPQPRPMTMADPQTARIVEMFKGMERRFQKQQEEIEALRKQVSELKSAMKQENKRDDKKAE